MFGDFNSLLKIFLCRRPVVAHLPQPAHHALQPRDAKGIFQFLANHQGLLDQIEGGDHIPPRHDGHGPQILERRGSPLVWPRRQPGQPALQRLTSFIKPAGEHEKLARLQCQRRFLLGIQPGGERQAALQPSQRFLRRLLGQQLAHAQAGPRRGPARLAGRGQGVEGRQSGLESVTSGLAFAQIEEDLPLGVLHGRPTQGVDLAGLETGQQVAELLGLAAIDQGPDVGRGQVGRLGERAAQGIMACSQQDIQPLAAIELPGPQVHLPPLRPAQRTVIEVAHDGVLAIEPFLVNPADREQGTIGQVAQDPPGAAAVEHGLQRVAPGRVAAQHGHRTHDLPLVARQPPIDLVQ